MDVGAEGVRGRAGFAWGEFGVASVVLAVLGFRFAGTVADPDLWGHLRFGLDAIGAGEVARADPYSYLTAGQGWINHEWLAEVGFAAVYRALGAAGLVGLKVGIDLAIVGLCYRHLDRRGLEPARAGMLLLLASLPLSYGLTSVRPQAFTHLLFLLLLLVLEGDRAGRGARIGWVVPIFGAWANLHGGFLAGAGVLVLWATIRVGSSTCGRGRIVAATALGLAATLVNPYGLQLWTFLLRTATVPRPEIAEWAPTDPATVQGAGTLALLVLTAAALVASRRPKDPALVVPMAVVAALPWISVRHAPLFAMAALVLASEHLADAWGRLATGRGDLAGASRAFGVAGPVVALALWGASLPRFAGIGVDPGAGFGCPARAVGLLARAGVRGNLAIHFDWGEYAIWHLGPGIRVSVDGRRETVYGAPAYAENLRFLFGEGDWSALIRRPETDLALVPCGSTTFGLLAAEPGWGLAYRDDYCGLFARSGSDQARRLAATTPPDLPADGAGLAFPAGPRAE